MTFHLVEEQEKSQWCWAAVAQTVGHYYAPSSTMKQCAIARSVLRLNQCCDDAATEESCDQTADLKRALKAVGRDCVRTSGALAFGQVRAEIDAGRPVCVRIGWPGGGGHAVIISGYRIQNNGAQQIKVQDPLRGGSWRDYETFPTAHRLCGEWADTYLIRG